MMDQSVIHVLIVKVFAQSGRDAHLVPLLPVVMKTTRLGMLAAWGLLWRRERYHAVGVDPWLDMPIVLDGFSFVYTL